MPYSKKEKRRTNKELDKIAKKAGLKVGRVKLEENLAFKKITITLPEDIVEKLSRLAKNENRSKSNMVRQLIEGREEKELK